MKPILLSLSAAVFVAIGAASPARAEIEYPWCAYSCTTGGAPLCSYTTIEQCRASLVGGYCQPNPRANASPAALRRSAR
jgi:hypothetical protein